MDPRSHCLESTLLFIFSSANSGRKENIPQRGDLCRGSMRCASACFTSMSQPDPFKVTVQHTLSHRMWGDDISSILGWYSIFSCPRRGRLPTISEIRTQTGLSATWVHPNSHRPHMCGLSWMPALLTCPPTSTGLCLIPWFLSAFCHVKHYSCPLFYQSTNLTTTAFWTTPSGQLFYFFRSVVYGMAGAGWTRAAFWHHTYYFCLPGIHTLTTS